MTPEFWLTTLVVVATPGTGVLYTVSAGLGRGGRVAVVAALGCTLGIVPHLVAAITGLAALLQASGVAFAVVKYAGVAYLLWMAWQTWRDTGALVTEQRAPVPLLRVVGQGIAVNLLNPKLTLFFVAFLPQFLPHGAGVPGAALPQMLAMSGVFMAVTFVVFVLYGLFAGAVRDQVALRPRLVQAVRRSFAVGFAVLAGRLALTER